MLARILFILIACFSSVSFAQEIDAQTISALKKATEKSDSFVDHIEAQVWLALQEGRLEKYNKLGGQEERLELLRLIHKEATLAGLKPELVLAVIHVESWFKADAVSVAGAQGLMQVMPFWKKEIGHSDDDLFDVKTNLRYGCAILAHYIERESGNVTKALARYNGSRGRLKYPYKVHQKYVNIWRYK